MTNDPELIDVPEESVGTRIDSFLAEYFDDFSRSYLKKLLSDGNVLVGEKAVKASYKLRPGDKLSVTLPEIQKTDIVPENIPLEIVYEDDDVIVVNKPQGMVVHPAPGNFSGTLVNALMYHCGDSLSSINGVERPGIVHRIDKDTSGLLVVCKTNTAHQGLAKQFEEHSINRIYSCIVYNHFDEPEITVNKPIARAKNDRKKMAITPDGRRAVTHVYLQENLKDGFAYVFCKLETGRTHQIRVHLTSINHPLLGDPVYGPKKCPFNLQGQALHAGTLGFVHPVTGEYLEFKSELPDYFQKLLKNLEVS